MLQKVSFFSKYVKRCYQYYPFLYTVNDLRNGSVMEVLEAREAVGCARLINSNGNFLLVCTFDFSLKKNRAGTTYCIIVRLVASDHEVSLQVRDIRREIFLKKRKRRFSFSQKRLGRNFIAQETRSLRSAFSLDISDRVYIALRAQKKHST